MQSNPAPTVLITGTSTGIGAACALELARRGWQVFAGVRQPADADRLRSLAAEHGGDIQTLLVDVTEEAAIQDAALQVTQVVGDAGLDALVNNAGIVIAGPLEILPLESFRQQLEVNLMGTLAMTQAFLPLLRKSSGRLVNVSSVNGAVASPYLGAYAASKHALEAVSDSLRVELRHWGIDVVLIEPGPTQTPIWQKSEATSDAIAAKLASESLDIYADDSAAMRKAVEGLAARAVPVERVVRAVVQAVSARRPRTRYYVTWESRLAFKALRMLPDRFHDWIVRRALGLR